MEIRYFLSIVLVLQSIISTHCMMPCMTNLIRNSRMFLPTLAKRTAPLLAKSLQTTVPNKSISLPAYKLFQQTHRPQNFNRNFLVAATGLSLWGYNKLNSMTVHAQEEKLKCSKEMEDLSHKFGANLSKNNLIEAQGLLFDMANNLKNDDDYIALAEYTNEFLIKAESALTHQVLQEKKEGIPKSIQLHVYRILMANGMIKSIQETKNVIIPQPYFSLFSAVSKNDLTKKMYLDAIIKLESNIIYDNTKNTPTVHNETLLIILGTIKAILNGEI